MNERSIFITALEKEDPAERRAYLEEACRADPALRQHVEKLLRAHAEAGGILDMSPVTPEGKRDGTPGQATTVAPQPVTEGVGSRIGPYKLLQLIGEGGMGTVWMAEQREPVRRQVALKVIKAGMDSRQVVTRFEAERQALALMDHPNIARVFDGGTTETGRPFFVMELVKGTTITHYCDEHRLTIPQRLELFVQVCRAIQHAHQKGIIHRDIKPSNVFVAPFDGRPVVKVIDFGVAKATGQMLTEKTMYTAFGAVVGTMQYMSPEQAELNNQDIDTRSDIYSLGVLLYELLTGTTPLDMHRLRGAALVAMLMAIKEEEPAKPSTRLSQSKDSLPSISAQRQMEPAKLAKSLRGELDSIVMKALEKDRNRRFATALELAADIERHLTNEPVLACPPSVGYRLKKFTRKHRGPITAATGVLAALVLGLASTTILYFEADTAKRSESLERQQAERDREAAKLAEANAKREADRADANAKLARRHLYAAHMNLAHAAWETARVGRVLDLLKQHEPQPGEEDLRGFEWHYWNRLAHSYQLNLEGHTDLVNCVAFSADGKRLASASQDQTVKVWDAMTGQETLTLKGHSEPVSSVAFSPDGKRLASAGQDQTVKVWDATSGRETLTLNGHSEMIMSVVFSPDGQRLASASYDKTVRVWDATTGQETLTLKGHTLEVNSVAFSADGKRLASASHDNSVKVWDATTGQETLTLKGHTNAVMSVSFSPDGKRLASASQDQTVKVWDATSGQETLTLKGHTGWLASVAFSPDGNRLTSASQDQTVKVWDATSGQETLTLKGHAGNVMSVVFSPDGKRLASASFDHTVKVWDATSGQETLTLGSDTWACGVAFSPDGKRLASASPGGTVTVWDATGGQETLTSKWHTEQFMEQLTSLALSADGKRLASASNSDAPDEPGEVKVWNATSGQEMLTLKHSMGVNSVAFSPDGNRLASASDDETVKLWDATTGQEILTLKGHTDSVTSVAFSPDGKWLASASNDKTVKLWDATTGQEILTLEHTFGCVAFSADGKRLASASEGGTVKVWDATSGQETLTLKGHTMGVSSVAFSPDGKRLASASSDETVKVWDATSGQETLTLTGHTGAVYCVAFSPDGKRLASGSLNGGVKVWDARPWTPELRAEQEAQSLVRFYSTPLISNDELLARIRADATVSEPVRGRALELAQRARENPQALARRGLAYAHLKQWDHAAAEYEEAVQLRPDDPDLLCEYGAVLLLSDDVDSFHMVLGTVWERFAKTTDPRTKYLVARIATMSPSSAPEPARVVALAEEAAASAPKDTWDPKAAWYLHTLGVAHYRAAQFDQAARRLHESIDASPNSPAQVVNWLALAMTHQRLGEFAEARQWLDRATHWLEHSTEEGHGRSFDDIHPHDRLTCLLLLREAKQLLDGEAR
jgi:WD40 repeat protein/serine/threonine protein kinase/tetratricopeptide (TPR) repeat protein